MSERPQISEPPAEQYAVADEALLAALRAGDPSAGDELVRRYTRILLGYLHRLTGSASAAEDLHQQTWLSAMEHLDRFDDRSNRGFKAWLFRIATNKANDYWRSRARQRRLDEGLRAESLGADSAPDSSEPLRRSEDVRRLQEAIEHLPEAQRQVVCLRFYSDMKFVDIAELLGCPLNTALGRMHKALLKLRQMMETDTGAHG